MTDLVLGNDVAGKVLLDGSEQRLDSPELSQLEEVFTACVDTCAQNKREAQKHVAFESLWSRKIKKTPLICQTVFAQLEDPPETNTRLQKEPIADVSQVE